MSGKLQTARRKKMMMELRESGFPIHPDIDKWSDSQVSTYVSQQKRARRIRQTWQRITVQRAAGEDFKPKWELEYNPPDYEPAETPRYIVRANYGPLAGMEISRILVLKYDKRYLSKRVRGGIRGEEFLAHGSHFDPQRLSFTPPTSEEDPVTGEVRDIDTDLVEWRGELPQLAGKQKTWGPREFLWNLLDIVGRYHGDCEVFLLHSNKHIRVDPEAFLQWATQSEVDPVSSLAGLLEGDTTYE